MTLSPSILFNSFCRNSGNGNPRFCKRFVDHRVGAYGNMIGYLNVSDNNRAKANIDIITNHRTRLAVTAVSDTVIAMQLAVFSDFRINCQQ